MNRPHPSLAQHLLTRSDLAQLEIPAARVVHWLSKGWLEQVAALPVEHGVPDPVFAVLDDTLRDELSSRLVELGKAEVVFSPLRVRSVLLRSLVQANGDSGSVQDLAPGMLVQPPADPLLDALTDPWLAQTLELAAVGLANEAQRAVALARAEAHLEILEKAVAVAVARSFELPAGSSPATKTAGVAAAEPATGGLASAAQVELQHQADDQEVEIMDKADDEGQFFDAGDLMAALGEEAGEATDSQPTPVEVSEIAQAEPIEQVADLSMVADLQATEAMDMQPVPAEAPLADANAAVEPVPDDMAIAELDRQVRVPSAGGDVEQVLDYLVASMQAAAEAHDAAVLHEPAFHENVVESPEGDGTDSEALAMESVAPLTEHQEGQSKSANLAHGIESQALAKVEQFLAELRSSLIQIADRPQVESVDLQPIAVAIADNARASQDAAKDGVACLRQLGDRVSALGERLEHGLALAVHAAMARQPSHGSAPPAATPAPSIVMRAADPTVTAVAAIAFLLACWSAVIWWKTGNAKLSIAVLVGANAVGCCLLLGRRRV